MIPSSQTFSLENFEGPLDLLLYLVQKSEIDIYDISLAGVTQQLLEFCQSLVDEKVDAGAEMLSTTAQLLLLKSKHLLPRSDQSDDEEEELELDPHFEIIHQLMDYVRFRDLGKKLREQEAQASHSYFRGIDPLTQSFSKPLGLDQTGLHDLYSVFSSVLDRAASMFGEDIEEETWRIADKVQWIKRELRQSTSLIVKDIFTSNKSRGELIVTFLAILELMKLGTIQLNSTDGELQIEAQSRQES